MKAQKLQQITNSIKRMKKLKKNKNLDLRSSGLSTLLFLFYMADQIIPLFFIFLTNS